MITTGTTTTSINTANAVVAAAAALSSSTNPQFPIFPASKPSWADEVEEWEEEERKKPSNSAATWGCGTTNPQFPVAAAGKFNWAEDVEEEEEEEEEEERRRKAREEGEEEGGKVLHSSVPAPVVTEPRSWYVAPPPWDTAAEDKFMRDLEQRTTVLSITNRYEWLLATRPWIGNYPNVSAEEWRRIMKRHWDRLEDPINYNPYGTTPTRPRVLGPSYTHRSIYS